MNLPEGISNLNSPFSNEKGLENTRIKSFLVCDKKDLENFFFSWFIVRIYVRKGDARDLEISPQEWRANVRYFDLNLEWKS